MIGRAGFGAASADAEWLGGRIERSGHCKGWKKLGGQQDGIYMTVVKGGVTEQAKRGRGGAHT